jgi:uncharacterized repeat protein (TIGR01451 family)
LLFARFTGPEGLKVTFYQGGLAGRTFTAPFQVGLRPGYIYRIKVSGFPNHPEVILFPTLEVRGTLMLSPHLKAADYPAPVSFGGDDLTEVLSGAVLTKVLLLEHPDRALPTATLPDRPVELRATPDQDPLKVAREHGRPVLIMRVGMRDFNPEEIARQAVPGTVLLPGDKFLGSPGCRPWVPWECFPVYDPILGPRPPEDECLHDGGDAGLPAGIDREGRLRGLDQADTVAEYSDCHGRRRLAVSNRVCLCVPRYLVIRSETFLAGFETLVGPAAAHKVQGQVLLRLEQPSGHIEQANRPAALRGQKRLSGANNVQQVGRLVHLEVLQGYLIETGPGEVLGTRLLLQLTEEKRTALKKQVELALQLSQPFRLAGVEQVQGPAVVGRVRGVNVFAQVQEVRDITVCCNEKPLPPAKPLVLCKWADRQCAKVGDVVTFFLKYSNYGGQPITDVAISDSLTGRLEYVPGSAKADRDAVFTVQDNEAGSVILRWEIGGPLLPGQHGVVSFKARVR